jgi:hypothetical protein
MDFIGQVVKEIFSPESFFAAFPFCPFLLDRALFFSYTHPVKVTVLVMK